MDNICYKGEFINTITIPDYYRIDMDKVNAITDVNAKMNLLLQLFSLMNVQVSSMGIELSEDVMQFLTKVGR